jgi:hypothetical protein
MTARSGPALRVRAPVLAALGLASAVAALPTAAHAATLFDSTPVSTTLPSLPWQSPFALGDVNGDGLADLVTPTIYNQIRILPGVGDGTFLPGTAHLIDGVATAIDFGDLDQDGASDVLIGTESGVTHMRSHLDGTFDDYNKVLIRGTHQSGNLVAADLDGDDHRDLVTSSEGIRGFVVQHLRADLTPRDSVRAYVSVFTPTTYENGCHVVAGDFDHDGLGEVIAGTTDIGCWLHRGTWDDTGEYLGPGNMEIVAGDFDEDGWMDVVCGAYLYRNDHGSLVLASSFPGTVRVSGDIDGDGHQDLVFTDGTYLTVHRGLGDGTFDPTDDLIPLADPEDVRLADVNGDGRLDLAFSHRSEARMDVHLYSPTGPTSVLASNVLAEADAGVVRLAWRVGASCGAVDVERQAEDAGWATVARLDPDGQGDLRFTDRDVRGGRSYAYRVAWTCARGRVEAGEVRVTLPMGLAFALGPVRPNPAGARSTVECVLPRSGDVVIETYDLSGRRIDVERLGVLSAGHHEVALSSAGRLSNGVYHLVLRQSSQATSTRFVVSR